MSSAVDIIKAIETEQFKSDIIPFNIGDTIKVHTRVKEGDKSRIQIFSGVVIAKKGSGINSNFTVRRISYGEGVERIFPLHSPNIAKVEIDKHGDTRRAKLYYLRDRIGKKALFIKEKGVKEKK